MTDTLEDVADRMAITELVHRYARHVHQHDRRDTEMMASCFTKDAVMEFDGGVSRRVSELGLTGPNDPVILRKVDGLDRVDLSTTAATNVSVELHGDTATVENMAVTTLVGERDGVPAMRVRGLRFYDEVVRRNGEWKFARRRHSLLWAFAPTPTGAGE
ncbi:nuclear transport factor 2 family protein [Nocardia sp. NPDC051787]|uniref:nuclear transport factor 2 family protein n=1 Tax=Nocardia sp. NPDC051787 TaxID=3155415 RepID=UPI00342EFF60